MTEPVVTYTWKIERLDAAPTHGQLEDVVSKIHWSLTATDGTNSTSTYGDINLGDPDPQNFTEYNDLTQGQVISWLESTINSLAESYEEQANVAELRTGLAGVLAAIRTPPVVPMDHLPWEN